jgi:hypothetical protein
MKTFKTFLPIFTGFYYTIFEPDNEDQEINEINNLRNEKGLEPITFDDCNFDYNIYFNEVSKECTDYIEKELKEHNVLNSIKFEALHSPKEYNFHNDSINIEVELSKDNIKIIKKYIFDNLDDYRTYLKENYTSCSGFISFFSNHLDGWQEITKDFNDFSEKMHLLGSVLNFICMIEEIDQNTMYDSIETHSVYASNYNELVEG